MLKFPLKQTYKNMLLTKNGTVYAYYKLTPQIISRANLIEQENYKNKFTIILDELTRYRDIHLQMLPKNMNLEDRFEKLSEDFDPNYYDCAKYYSDETINILKSELGTITQYEFYIGVRIDQMVSAEESGLKTATSVIRKTSDTLANLLGYDIAVTDEFFFEFSLTEKKLFNDLQTLDIKRVTEDELNYLIRYNFLGSSIHNVEEESKKRGTLSICNAEIDNREKCILKIDTEDKTIYKSYLVLENTNTIMNNFHLFEDLQTTTFPIEIHLKAKVPDKFLFDTKLSNKTKTTNEQAGDEYSGKGKLNDESFRLLYLMDRLDNEHSQGKNFLEWLLVIVVTDTNKEMLERKIKSLQTRVKSTSHKKEKGNNLVCPIADQLQLFYLFSQGEELGMYNNWLQLTTTESLSELLFGVTQRLGTNIGFYLGRIDKFLKSNNINVAIENSRDIVLFHQMLANKGITGAKTDSPHIAITGQTGKGKSFVAKLLYMYSLFLDIKTLYFDPKSEMKNWFTKVTEDEKNQRDFPLFVDLLNSIKYLTLDYTKEENYGILDPLTFLEGEEAKELIEEMFFEIINLDKLENLVQAETVILKAVRTVIDRKNKGEQVGSLHIIKELQNHKEEAIRNIGDNLYEKTQNGMLKLLVYDGSNQTISLNNKSTILQVFGLDLPQATDSKDTYTPSQKKSLLVMQLLGKFMGKFGSNHKEQTMIYIDEAWSFSVTKIGRAIKKQLERIGRSMNNALIFITQLVNDIKDETGVAGNYGCVFAFDEEQDRDNILDLLSLEKNTTNYEILSHMKKGQCLFKDFYGRVSKLSVHCLFDEWIQAFKTVEKTSVANFEERFN